MKVKRLILTGVIFNAAIAGVIWVAISGWPSIIIRNNEYRELISNFQQAQLRDRINGNKDVDSDMAGWDFQVQVPEKQITAQVKAAGHLGVVWIQYKGENNPNHLYKYVDYSHVQEIKTAENILYVHWVEILFQADHWLIAYDLKNRRELVRRKIDLNDLAQSH
jgi:hypothetical protein